MDTINVDNIQKKIIDFYNKKGFLETYGTDLYVAIFIILLFFVMTCYFIVINNLTPIKSDWVNQRCNPSVIPFAGLINAPDGSSKFDYTAQNFSGCMNNILKTVSEYALQPIYYISNTMLASFKEMIDALQSIRSLFNKIRNNVKDISEEILNRTLNITIPLMQLFINAKDMLGKVQGTMTASLYTLFGSYLGMMSLFSNIYGTTIKIILILVGIILVSFATLNFGFAAVTIAFATPIAIAMGLIASFMHNVLHLSGFKGVPKIPHCFDENVMVNLIDGSIKKFKDVKINDVLFDGAIVTSFMKMTSADHIMYKIGNIIVTGTHKVFHKKKGWILVRDHPDAIKINNYTKPYIYCLGTSNKLINLCINNVNDNNECDKVIAFADWDELEDEAIKEITKNSNHLSVNFHDSKNIHKYLDGGLLGDTQIELKNGKNIKIKDIAVNDLLKSGEQVLGTVKIDATKLSGVYEYKVANKIIKGGPNLQIRDINLGIIDTTKIKGKQISNIDFVYHLITDKRTYMVNGLKICDYNACTEKFMNDERFNILLSTLI